MKQGDILVVQHRPKDIRLSRSRDRLNIDEYSVNFEAHFGFYVPLMISCNNFSKPRVSFSDL